MTLPKDDAAILSTRWAEGVLLKRDVFSSVERGRFRDETGDADAVLRRIDQVPMVVLYSGASICSRASGAHWQRRGDFDVGPELLWAGRKALVRGFIDGVALHLAKPYGDMRLFSFRQAGAARTCIAPASATTISRRNKTGCAAAMAVPISPTFSSPPASQSAAGCSGLPLMRISGICSSTSAATPRMR